MILFESAVSPFGIKSDDFTSFGRSAISGEIRRVRNFGRPAEFPETVPHVGAFAVAEVDGVGGALLVGGGDDGY